MDLALVRKTLRSERSCFRSRAIRLPLRDTANLQEMTHQVQTRRSWTTSVGSMYHLSGDTDPKQMLVTPLSVVNLINTKEPNKQPLCYLTHVMLY